MAHSILPTVAASVILLLACQTSGESAPADTVQGEGACRNSGGSPEVLREGETASAWCAFGAAKIGSSALGQGAKATAVYLAHPEVAKKPPRGGAPHIANPSSLYCMGVGGESIIVADKSGGQLGICRFADLSGIEEWTLYRGPDAAANLALTAALKKLR